MKNMLAASSCNIWKGFPLYVMQALRFNELERCVYVHKQLNVLSGAVCANGIYCLSVRSCWRFVRALVCDHAHKQAWHHNRRLLSTGRVDCVPVENPRSQPACDPRSFT